MHIPQNVFVKADDLVINIRSQIYCRCYGFVWRPILSVLKIIADGVDLFGDLYYQYFIKFIADGVEGKTGSERRPLGDLFWRRLCPTSFDAENFHALVIKQIVSEI